MSETLYNASTGETITFIERTPEALIFEDHLPADCAGVPFHFHERQSETFTVLEGVFQAEINGEQCRLDAGEAVTIPAGVAHRFDTHNNGPVRLRVELRPALDYEDFFRGMASAAAAGRGMPLQVALMTRELDLGFRIAGMPRPVQAIAFGLMAMWARVIGYTAKP